MAPAGWGAAYDDMGKFFPGSPWAVPAADVWRWRACCEAVRRYVDQAAPVRGARRDEE